MISKFISIASKYQYDALAMLEKAINEELKPGIRVAHMSQIFINQRFDPDRTAVSVILLLEDE